ncbi:MAG TPA: 50S ribosomal protein L1 [Candidatus Sumerlaeota bacterium]|nr:50S ribosomal protein L1 [Candidatus Sumerlaeota bacterium]
MPKHGKQYRAAIEQVDRQKRYTISEAVALLKKANFAKFDESVDLDLRLGVDPRNAEQQVRGTVNLPHGTGKKVRVAVFAKGDAAREAEEAGADVVGAEDLVQKIQGGFLEFDAAVATPDMMREVSKIGRVLGPRGLMPNPKTGTVTNNVSQVVQELKAGKVEYRLDRNANVHCTVGKKSFAEEALAENVQTLIDAIQRARPASAKGVFMRSATLSTTMGPGIKLAV